jgi:hypothetical protein
MLWCLWRQIWITVVVSVLSATMSTSAIDSLQNAIVDNISGSFLKSLPLLWVRALVLVLNVPVIVVSLQARQNPCPPPSICPASCLLTLVAPGCTTAILILAACMLLGTCTLTEGSFDMHACGMQCSTSPPTAGRVLGWMTH